MKQYLSRFKLLSFFFILILIIVGCQPESESEFKNIIPEDPLDDAFFLTANIDGQRFNADDQSGLIYNFKNAYQMLVVGHVINDDYSLNTISIPFYLAQEQEPSPENITFSCSENHNYYESCVNLAYTVRLDNDEIEYSTIDTPFGENLDLEVEIIEIEISGRPFARGRFNGTVYSSPTKSFIIEDGEFFVPLEFLETDIASEDAYMNAVVDGKPYNDYFTVIGASDYGFCTGVSILSAATNSSLHERSIQMKLYLPTGEEPQEASYANGDCFLGYDISEPCVTLSYAISTGWQTSEYYLDESTTQFPLEITSVTYEEGGLMCGKFSAQLRNADDENDIIIIEDGEFCAPLEF